MRRAPPAIRDVLRVALRKALPEAIGGAALAVALGACSGRASTGGEGPAASGSAIVGPASAAGSASGAVAEGSPFARLRDAYVEEWLRDEPSQGRVLGLRSSEGKVAEYGREAIAKRVERLRRRRAELGAFDQAGLGPEEAFDRALLLYQIDNALFHLVELDEPTRLPQYYAELFAVDHYIKRDYAPLAQRAERLVEHEEAALAQARGALANLSPSLSRPVAETGAQIYAGYADYLRKDVVRALAPLGPGPLRERFERANGALAAEADAVVGRLREAAKRGEGAHAIGAEKFLGLLRVQEGFVGTLAEFREMGEKDLARNRAAYEAAAAKLKPSRPAAEALLGATTAVVEEARAFVVRKGLVTLATEDTAGVRESPPFLRWNSAFLDASGPLDPARDAFYYVTLPDPAWPAKERAEYVPTYGDISSTTTHEVYPGHFVQLRWLERAPTKVQKMVANYSFIEGWAHYAEQMMVEQGFAGGGSAEESRRGQLSDALLRDCRYVVAHGVHAAGMTLEQAEARFQRDCHQDRATARQQARRATFDPGYFAYTYGKLQILALREELEAKLGPAFSLRRFHDELLAHGQPPLGLLRTRVLGALAPGR
ncbi:MAG: DUF885 domain-containing protein [Polyangiaceae bacterium]|nr:DUF885 domain-containing protein [Polyangiaceae bacterium]